MQFEAVAWQFQQRKSREHRSVERSNRLEVRSSPLELVSVQVSVQVEMTVVVRMMYSMQQWWLWQKQWQRR